MPNYARASNTNAVIQEIRNKVYAKHHTLVAKRNALAAQVQAMQTELDNYQSQLIALACAKYEISAARVINSIKTPAVTPLPALNKTTLNRQQAARIRAVKLRKLTPAQAVEIRAAYPRKTMRELGAQYGVSCVTICRIVNNVVYKE